MTTEHPTEHPTPYDVAPALEVLLVDLTAAVRETNQSVVGLQGLLAPLAATQQVGDRAQDRRPGSQPGRGSGRRPGGRGRPGWSPAPPSSAASRPARA
ncbi:hypothetical protein G5V59_08930 [Nocardioides sp. W3-2-3]|uniref:hypothetical protein n=1 Tax=Nocardioides convexus TaxID=2712224 RepID=UPI00241842DD|nr:hypothetical protein [Nocardioides convexus]NHA00209.1 hypothetical protein [Nocardioides convexus]